MLKKVNLKMIELGRIEIINEMIVVAIPLPSDALNEYQYQIRWIDGPVFYKRKVGDVEWGFTTAMDFIKNVKSHNLVDWMQAPDKYQDQIKGGIADERNPLQFNNIELEKGIKVELEHTSDPMIASEIAMDHLSEDPDYYNKLATLKL